MAIDRSLWNAYHYPNEIPHFKCPKCQTGTLIPQSNPVNRMIPQYTIRERDHPDWEPEWDISTWSEICKCSNNSCGQSVHLSGKAQAHEEA